MFAVFGPGSVYVTRTDVPDQTPVNIGYAQSFSLDETGDTKQLFGERQYPLAAARGTIKATGKMVAAEISGIALNSVFHGDAFEGGQLIMDRGRPYTIPGSVTPGALIVSPPDSGTFDSDLGVLYASTGLPFVKVASLTADGQYTQAGANYGFHTGDYDEDILITYSYTVTGSGQTLTVTNKLIGTAPTFQIDYATVQDGKPYYLRIFRCISSKLAQSFKLTDFMMPEVDFDIFANPAGNVYTASFGDVS